jgi:4-aminobutyrate aminotransferase-like enzyme
LGEADVLAPGLAKELSDRHPSVGEVRGLGVFWALELVKDRETREPLVPYNAAGADAKLRWRAGQRLQGQGDCGVHPTSTGSMSPRRSSPARPTCVTGFR